MLFPGMPIGPAPSDTTLRKTALNSSPSTLMYCLIAAIGVLGIAALLQAAAVRRTGAHARRWRQLATMAGADAPLQQAADELGRILASRVDARAYALYRYDETSKQFRLSWALQSSEAGPMRALAPITGPERPLESGAGLNTSDAEDPPHGENSQEDNSQGGFSPGVIPSGIPSVPSSGGTRREAWMDPPATLVLEEPLLTLGVTQEQGVNVFNMPLRAGSETAGLFRALHCREAKMPRRLEAELSDLSDIGGAILSGAARRKKDRGRLSTMQTSARVGEAMLQSSLNVQSLIGRALHVVLISTQSGGAAVRLDPDVLSRLGLRQRDMGTLTFAAGDTGRELLSDSSRWNGPTFPDKHDSTGALRPAGSIAGDTAPTLMEHIPVGEISAGSLLLARGVSEPYGPSHRHMARLFAGQLGEIMQNAAALRATERTYRDTLQMLVGLMDSRQPETQGHSSRVRRWSVLIGRAMGLDTDQLETLEWSALLHDVGMSGIPDEVLKTKGGVTTDEYQLIRQHPDLGAVMAEPLHLPLSLSPGIRSHHERWDGRGYPDRLAGGQIPVHGRIIAVAEVFNALVSPRSYRTPRSYADALKIIHDESGRSFDPRVVAAFQKAIQAEAAASVPPRCFELKGMSSDLCASCPAFKAPEPCWQVRGVLCEIHGDRRCEDCFVYTRAHETGPSSVSAPTSGLVSIVSESTQPHVTAS